MTPTLTFNEYDFTMIVLAPRTRAGSGYPTRVSIASNPLPPGCLLD
jgi:hypothetical protein